MLSRRSKRNRRSCKTITSTASRVTLQPTTAVAPPTISTIQTSLNPLSPLERKTRDLLLNPIIENLFIQKLASKQHRLPNDAISSIVSEYSVIHKWMTKDIIKSRLRRKYQKYSILKKSQSQQSEKAMLSSYEDQVASFLSTTPSTPTQLLNEKIPRKKGGRPKGTSYASISHLKRCENEAKAEIVDAYMNIQARYKARGMKRVGAGEYLKIHNNIKQKRNLPDTFEFPYNTAKRRIQKSIQLDERAIPIKRQSPLRGVEDDIVNFLTLLAKLGSPISCGQGVHIINDLIRGTVYQEQLIEYKKKQGIVQSEDKLGMIGHNYWYAFLERNKDKLETKKGRKFELDRSKWTKYRNFKKMYDDIEDDMVDAGVAIRLDEPVWMDKEGNRVEEKNSVGFKVRSKLTRPDMCVVMDEVGCNLSMMKDGHAGGQKFVVGKGNEAKLKGTKKEKHFTCLGLTLLSGEPLMCVVLIDGQKEDLLVRTGIDPQCSSINNTVSELNDEYEYFKNNIGIGKQYPGGPSCYYQGTEIPCMVEFVSGGGMNGAILTKIFKTLDTLSIFSQQREEGIRPFVLLDGHSSRFDVEFLKYINDPTHMWSVCIGVPYGTSLWQVGDSVQQNGVFKIRLTLIKQKLIELRSEKQMSMELLPFDIIPIVNYGWMGSFQVKKNNLKAILERGWNPLNRMLLLHPSLRNDMTEKDIAEEIDSGLFPNHTFNNHNYMFNIPTTTIRQQNLPTMRNNNNPTSRQREVSIHENNCVKDLDFGSGLPMHFLKKIVNVHDFEKAREIIIEDRATGENEIDLINKMPKATAGNLVIHGQTHKLGVGVLQYVETRVKVKREERETKRRTELESVKKSRSLSDRAIERNKDKRMLKSWTCTDLKMAIKPDKRKEDGGMPSKKGDLMALYRKVNERLGREVVPDVLVEEEATEASMGPESTVAVREEDNVRETVPRTNVTNETLTTNDLYKNAV
jgi:hypothetical protein